MPRARDHRQLAATLAEQRALARLRRAQWARWEAWERAHPHYPPVATWLDMLELATRLLPPEARSRPFDPTGIATMRRALAGLASRRATPDGAEPAG